jgi:hypothetical protein
MFHFDLPKSCMLKSCMLLVAELHALLYSWESGGALTLPLWRGFHCFHCLLFGLTSLFFQLLHIILQLPMSFQ